MSKERLLQGKSVVFIGGGWAELDTRIRSGGLELGVAEALVLREPTFPGSPHYVFGERDQKELFKLFTEESVPPERRWLNDRLGLDIAPVVGVGERLPGAVVIDHGQFTGVWLEHRGMLDWLRERLARIAGGLLVARYRVEQAGEREEHAPPVEAGRGTEPTVGRADEQGAAAGEEDEAEDAFAPLPRPAESQTANGGGGEPEAAANGAGDGRDGDPVIRRTPHLEAPKDIPTMPGSAFSVEVWTDTAAARQAEQSEEVVVEAPAHIQVVELGVLLSTSPHFVVDRDYFQRLRIDRKKRDSTRLRFELAVSDSDEAGPATVVAQFLYRGRPCGRVRREWSWPSGKELPLDEGPAGVPVHTDVQEPDLTVIITATGAGLFNCSIRAPELGGPEYSKPVLWDGVRDSAAGLVTKALAKLVDRRKSEQERRRALLKAGRTFWDAAPAPFQKTLWALIKAREARGAEGRASIYIASDEPLLPWEIMRPSRPRANQADEDRPLPLGVEFAIGRWVRGDATSPPPTLPVRDSFLIAASYDKEDDKLDPTAEKYALEKHFAGRQLDSANYDFLDDYLRQNTASLLHFVCHGGVEDSEPAIFLDGWAPCTSRDLRENTGIANVCGSRFPIIFLNACDAGQATVALGPGGSGFPKTLSELGARAIIAPVWPVTKTSAPQVAKEVYDRAAANPDESLAEILADLRSRSYENGPFDDSWAAYCLFGDPNGKLRRA